jgi:putative spermidine/putrescine transport system ATP-binding protein
MGGGRAATARGATGAGTDRPDGGETAAGALRLERVTRRFRGAERPAVDEVSLDVRSGELLALVGASGSGKTTTLRIAAGYEQPDRGRVVLIDQGGAQRDITRLPPQARGFGMVFQHYALFPHMTVGENVAFGLEARSVRKQERLERARVALAGVGLEGSAARAVQSLSGGEQQRVALARALVIEPRVLLLAAPRSNRAPTLREAPRDAQRAMLRRLGVTALFVTHDQEDAFAIADRVAVLRQGRLLQVGAPEELYERPASRHVAQFIGRATLVPAEWAGERARIAVGGVVQEGPALTGDPAVARASGPRWLAVLRPESLTIDYAERTDAPAWAGEIVSRRFAGGHLVYVVRLTGDVRVEVSTDDGAWTEGQSVTVGSHIANEPDAQPKPPPTPMGHPVFWTDEAGRKWLLFGDPFPTLRCPPWKSTPSVATCPPRARASISCGWSPSAAT